MSSSTLRGEPEYITLLHQFDEVVEQIWPEWESGDCNLVSQNPEHLEALIMTSYRLMKYIRGWLKKRRLPYKECLKFPNLYTALEHAVAVTQRGSGNLSLEADKLEAVSRAAYHWLKVSKNLGRQPTRVELDARPKDDNTTGGHRKIYCHCCKTNLATDDSDLLCDECSGATERNMSPVGKCSLCKMPCKAGEFYCDLCRASYSMLDKPTKDKQTSIVVDYPGLRKNPSPFEHIERDYPTLHDGPGDMSFSGNRWLNRKVR